MVMAENVELEEGKYLLETDKDTIGPDSKRKSSKVMVTLPNGANTTEMRHEFFGVRSYLHNFYESVSVKNPQLYEDIYEEDFPAAQARKRRLNAARTCWRFSIIIGVLLLLIGLSFLLFGYLMPTRNVIAGFKENKEIIDTDAQAFNGVIKLCRIIGLAIFCTGGGVFCLALLLPILINLQCDDDGSREPFQVVFAPEEPIRFPTDKKIPATEEVASIQPKREVVEDVVMTNSGLCKISIPSKVSDPQ